jgi:hypothetical protein
MTTVTVINTKQVDSDSPNKMLKKKKKVFFLKTAPTRSSLTINWRDF